MNNLHNTDFHTHSHLSDADPELSPAAVAAQAAAEGIENLSITDHDHLLHPTLCAALSETYHINLVPGCEFSTLWGNTKTGEPAIVHIGGHWLDAEDPVIQQILEYNQHLNYEAYVKLMLYKYNKQLPLAQRMNIDAAYETIKLQHPQAVHRGKRDVARFLVSSGRAADLQSAYQHLAYGGEAYVSPTEMLPFAPLEEVVSAITRKSLATLNHLFYSHLSPSENHELIRCFKAMGGQCLESQYSPYSVEKQAMLFEACDQYALLPNCGSDRHDTTRSFLQGSDIIYKMLHRRQLEQYGTTYMESWRQVLSRKHPHIWKETEHGLEEIDISELPFY